MVQGSMSCIKYLLFVFNFVFVLSGIALIVVGALIFNQYYTVFLDKAFLSGPAIVIAIGVIIFLIAFFGCCGAVKENSCMVTTFATILFIIFVVEIAGAATAYVYRGKLDDFLQKRMKNSLSEDKKDVQTAWDYMQKTFKCCGATGPADYTTALKNVPKSCCSSEIATCTVINAYPDGCYKSLYNQIKNNIIVVGGVAIGIAVVELIGVMFACCLSAAIRRDRDRRY